MPKFALSLSLALVAAVLLLASVAATASAHRTSSGAFSFDRPQVKRLKCGTGDSRACPRGYVLRVSGEYLRNTKSVVFLGAAGSRDDRQARPQEKSPHRVLVRVPRSARSGPVKVVSAGAASRRGPRLRVLGHPPHRSASQPTSTAAPSYGDGREGVFPVRGTHGYGTEVNRFGGGRNHKGQDVFAACGTPLVAALSGTVQWAKWHAAAGNYVVVQAPDGSSQAYMHMRKPTTLKRGDRVSAGQTIGEVGETGRASGCHLHFELWTSPGWYEGGKPIDPLPTLKRWDAAAGG